MKTEIFNGLIAVGQRIHCILYGGKDGTVVEIRGTQTPSTVQAAYHGVVMAGGKADLDIIWDDGTTSLSIPEALVRGSVQWTIYPEVASEDDIAQAYAKKVIHEAQEKARKDAEAAAYKAAKESALQAYEHLTKAGDGNYPNGKLAAKNLRIELKQAFPKVKFSVKSDYDSFTVSWTDGPTQAQVRNIADKYCNGGFDGMTDMEYSTPSAFTDIYGGARYQSFYRTLSDELMEKATDALWARLPGNLKDVERPSLQSMRNGHRDQIPSLDGTYIGESVQAIASSWDAFGKAYVKSTRYSRYDWMVFDGDKPVCQSLI